MKIRHFALICAKLAAEHNKKLQRKVINKVFEYSKIALKENERVKTNLK